MGWRGQANRDRDERARIESLPLARRYAWGRIALALIFILAVIAAFAGPR